jgi:hypothetical protein
MRLRGAIVGLAGAMLLCAAPAAAAEMPSPATAPALFSQVSGLSQVSELLGRPSRSPDPRHDPSFSLIRFKNHDGYTISVLASRQTVALRVARDFGRDHRPRQALTTTLSRPRQGDSDLDRGELWRSGADLVALSPLRA